MPANRMTRQKLSRNVVGTVRVNGIPRALPMSRPGLDAAVIVALQDVNKLVLDMRLNLAYPNGAWDEDSAVARYLMYLSVLVDLVLNDMVMSAITKNDIMVLAKLRMLIEYAVKGGYFDDYPQYALYMMTIGEAKDVYQKLKDAETDEAAIADAKARFKTLEQQFPAVVGLKKLRFDELMKAYGDRDDYVWQYRAPSTLIHGDPEGIRTLFEVLPDGQQRSRIPFLLEEVNAMLVDAGTNALFFCNHFIRRFKRDDKSLVARFEALHRRFLRLVLNHPFGRDDDSLQAVRMELGET
jgi:hypothetical protein